MAITVASDAFCMYSFWDKTFRSYDGKTIRTYRVYRGMNVYPIDENGLTNGTRTHPSNVNDSLDTEHIFEDILYVWRFNLFYYSSFMPKRKKNEYNRI